ncbi:MAG: transcription antitermination factor NusB [Peptostreptococcaceae bacterium]|nr:transcription antitermination factor NusB [Peptostreptococcaceae bacterium]
MAKSIRDARELAMKLVFQMDANNNFDYEMLVATDITEDFRNYPRVMDILENIKIHIKAIDKTIKDNSKNRKVARIPKTDVAILRVALCEILYLDDVPEAVSINEAVELAKMYGTDKSKGFVNALLGQVVRSK